MNASTGKFTIPQLGSKHTVVMVNELPPCDLCSDGREAQYDAKLVDLFGGQWANVCEVHFRKYGRGLGIGKGQKLDGAYMRGDTMFVKGVNIGSNVLTITKHMRAYVNTQGKPCEQCREVPDTLFQYWNDFADELPTPERIVRLLPEFCSHKCWKVFVDGHQFSDRQSTREVVKT